MLVTTPQELEAAVRGEGLTASGSIVNSDTAMRVAVVFRCVSIIAGAVATMPLSIKRRLDARTVEDARDHPLWALIKRRPNSWMTASAFRRMLQAHMLLRGNAYALIVRSRGKVLQLIPMHPDRVECKQNDDLSLTYIYTRRDGRQITLAQNEVFHLVGLTLDGITGVSVIKHAAETIGLSRAAEAHGAASFRNGTHLGAVLMHPGKLGKEGRENLQASLDNYRGAINANKNLILEEAMTYTPVGMTAEDAQYVETRKLSRSDIAMFFGVPPHMIGDTEKSTSWGNGIVEQAQGFVAYTLMDHLVTWEETINRDLIEANDADHYAKFNPAGLVRGDIEKRYRAYKIGREGGWLSANDIRLKEDDNPIDGGDTYLEPLNMKAAGDPSPADEPSSQQGETP